MTQQKHIEFKQTGIEWMPSIPKHWELWKINRAFNVIGSGTTPASGNSTYYHNGTINWINTGDLNDGILTTCENKITKQALENHTTLKLYQKGSIVIALYGATIGKVSILDIEACTNQACCVLSDSNVFHNIYLFYWFLANKSNLVRLGYGGGQPNISQEIIRQLRISTPPIAEQKAIADYLDRQSGKINTFIEKKKRFIELLKEQRQSIINEAVTKGVNPKAKMKPSGIEWLGDIPNHWEVRKLKYCVKLNCNDSIITSSTDKTIKIALENIESWTGKLFFNENIPFEGIGNYFKKGDVLFNKLRPYLAKVYLSEYNGLCVNELLVLSPENKFVTSEFLFQRLLSSEFISIVNSSTYGSKMPRANWDFIGNLKLPIPPLSEQKEIVTRIKQETEVIDIAMLKAEKEIELIKEYKESMIAEAVMGKIGV